jgi:formate dehydrogenase subunit gamma
LSSGLIIWDQYFFAYTGIQTKRIAILVHSIAATGAIIVLIIHIYAAFWIKGSLNAMTEGDVTGGWAWRHHRKWLRELAQEKNDAPARPN